MAKDFKWLLNKSGKAVRAALEAAAAECRAQTLYSLTPEHVLSKLIGAAGGDAAAILQRFGVDSSVLAADLARAMGRLRGGNRLGAPLPAPSLFDWMARARAIAPSETRAAGVRGGILILAFLDAPDFEGLRRDSGEWAKIEPAVLRRDFRAIVSGSSEGDPGASAPRGVPGTVMLRWVAVGMALYWIVLPVVMFYAATQAGTFLDQHLGAFAAAPGDPGYAAIARAFRRLVIVIAVVIGLAGQATIKLLCRQFVPSTGLDLAIEENDRRFEAWRRKPARNYSWPGILAYCGIILVISVSIAGLLLLWQVSKQSLDDKVIAIALTDAPSALPTGAKYVTIQGMVRAKLWLPYQSPDNSKPQAIALLTEEGWTPDRPVRYLGHYIATAADGGGKPEFPYSDHGGYPITFQGRAGAPVPADIVRSYRAQGIHIDPAAMVLDALPRDAMPAQDGVNYAYSIAAVIIGGVVALFTLLAMSLVKALGRIQTKTA